MEIEVKNRGQDRDILSFCFLNWAETIEAAEKDSNSRRD